MRKSMIWRRYKIIAMEWMLILASVLIFRSLWSFLDSLPWASEPFGQWVLFAAGSGMTFWLLYQIHFPARVKKKGTKKTMPSSLLYEK